MTDSPKALSDACYARRIRLSIELTATNAEREEFLRRWEQLCSVVYKGYGEGWRFPNSGDANDV